MLALIAALAVAQAQPRSNPIIENRRDRSRPAPRAVARTAASENAVQAAGSNTPIRRVAFQGARAPDRVAEVAAGFIGRAATRDTLVELVAAMSRAYERTDVAIYSVTIPDQQLTDGVVVVDLVERWVDDVAILATEGSRFPLLDRLANNLVGEKPLSRRRFERQSVLIQSIPGLEVEATVENPEGDDSVQFVLTPRQKRADAAFGINNNGPHLLGDVVIQGGVEFYRVLTDGDRLSFSGYATPEFRHYRASTLPTQHRLAPTD